ncbi:universal stress protein [Streptomyces odontomachi]|uniref:universal stress protein n=1 Tax=Streptomyces odontomachi TaxID=2944940 RepID=UPI00210D6BF4|nr:universal stress protein [Streptomyces sp. ODS25]
MSTLPIVVGVDGSDGSLRALDWALAEAQLRGAPLRLVHVRQYAAWTRPEALATSPQQPADDLVLARVLSSLTGRTHLPELDSSSLEGAPGAVLTEAGQSAQLLVLGSRGRGGFASLLLGSSGMAAARDAPCPVVVVPRPGREVPDTGPTEPGPRIVVGVSAETPDTDALSFACAEAARHVARLHVVCAYPWPAYAWAGPGDFVPTPEDQEAAQAATADQLDEILGPYRASYPDVTIQPKVLPGDAAGHLVAASKDAVLVVVGRHRRRLLHPTRLLGSVTHAVLLHAAAPIAVVPPSQPLEPAA